MRSNGPLTPSFSEESLIYQGNKGCVSVIYAV